MSQFIFPPLTASLDSEQTNGGSLPAKQMVIAGFDSTATRVLLTDSSGRLENNYKSLDAKQFSLSGLCIL